MVRNRNCARPGCGEPAAATLTYHYASRQVWLDDLDEEPEPGAHDLCAGHSEGVVVPVGWAIDDRRTPIIRLRPPLAG